MARAHEARVRARATSERVRSAASIAGARPDPRSDLPGFYRLSMADRVALVSAEAGLDARERAALSVEGGLRPEQAERMIENAIGVLGVPIGVCVNLRVDGRDRIVPMAIEEPSVIAAASHAAKLLRSTGGVVSEVAAPLMEGQVQLLDVQDPDRAETSVARARQRLLARANRLHPRLVAAGGGARDIAVHRLPPADEDDPLPAMLIAHLLVDVGEAMGANVINSMCEEIAGDLESLTGGRARLRILTNLCHRRIVTVRGSILFEALAGKSNACGADLAQGIMEASVFAERDPYRAATHNKGIMNGVDAALLALGQDWRAVEAGAHAYAAQDGRYKPLARWRVRRERLEGVLSMPMAVGLVGGILRAHPTVRTALRIACLRSAKELASTVAAVGLAQNLGALRALAAEGIQNGHMRLHARKLVSDANAGEASGGPRHACDRRRSI